MKKFTERFRALTKKARIALLVIILLGLCAWLLLSAEAAILLTRPDETVSKNHPLGESAYQWMISLMPLNQPNQKEPLPTLLPLPELYTPQALPTFAPTWTSEPQPTLPKVTLSPVFTPLPSYTPQPTQTPRPTSAKVIPSSTPTISN